MIRLFRLGSLARAHWPGVPPPSLPSIASTGWPRPHPTRVVTTLLPHFRRTATRRRAPPPTVTRSPAWRPPAPAIRIVVSQRKQARRTPPQQRQECGEVVRRIAPQQCLGRCFCARIIVRCGAQSGGQGFKRRGQCRASPYLCAGKFSRREYGTAKVNRSPPPPYSINGSIHLRARSPIVRATPAN
jgi:hypothetical protein